MHTSSQGATHMYLPHMCLVPTCTSKKVSKLLKEELEKVSLAFILTYTLTPVLAKNKQEKAFPPCKILWRGSCYPSALIAQLANLLPLTPSFLHATPTSNLQLVQCNALFCNVKDRMKSCAAKAIKYHPSFFIAIP